MVEWLRVADFGRIFKSRLSAVRQTRHTSSAGDESRRHDNHPDANGLSRATLNKLRPVPRNRAGPVSRPAEDFADRK
jgi:hypothetical protein